MRGRSSSEGVCGGSLFALVLVLCVLVCGLCWWLAHSSSDSGARPQLVAPSALDEDKSEIGGDALDLAGTRTQADEADRTGTSRIPAPKVTPGATAAPTGTITVRVADASGKPFTGAWTLEIEDTDLLVRRDENARRTLDKHGPSVQVPARSGVVHALCARSDAGASRTMRVELGTPPANTQVDLTLEPAARVSGRVVDERGQGVAGMRVWLVPHMEVPQGKSVEGGPTIGVRMGVAAVTDASGAYRTPPLQPGAWNVLAGDRESPLARSNDVAVAAGDVFVDPIALPRLYAVVVRVKDERGQTVAGAKVNSHGTQGGTIDGVTDANGELACDNLPPGRWRVFASAPDGRRTNVNVDVPLAHEGAPIELVLHARNQR